MEKIKDIPKEKFAYINEIGIQTQMYRQYARSKREKRVNIRISSKRYSQIGLVAAHCESEFVFPYIYDETMRASVFENWFEDELLKEFSSWITRHFIRKRSYRTLRKNNRGH